MKAAQSDGDGPVPTRVTEDESTHKEEAVSKPQRLEDAPPAVRDLTYSIFSAVEELDAITTLIDQELSEPYSVYTYRYFIYNWPQLCILCKDAKSSQLVGVIICKADVHKSGKKRGYIAMLVVDKPSRKQGIGAELVARALRTMAELGCDEAVLETELTNKGALRLYSNFGFLKDKRLQRYYLNGNDAFRLKLPLSEEIAATIASSDASISANDLPEAPTGGD